jgi:hypothetical protein
MNPNGLNGNDSGIFGGNGCMPTGINVLGRTGNKVSGAATSSARHPDTSVVACRRYYFNITATNPISTS